MSAPATSAQTVTAAPVTPVVRDANVADDTGLTTFKTTVSQNQQQNEGQDTGSVPLQSEQSKFVQHLATYPAISALTGLIGSFPLVKLFLANAIPLLHALHERTKPVVDPVVDSAEPLLRNLDNAGDAALTKLDSRFPQLHTVHPNDVYEGAHHYIDSVRGQACQTYEDRVTKPIANAATKAKNQYEAIYDTQVSSRVAPLNDRLAAAIDEILPEDGDTAEVGAEENGGSRSEVSRTYRLARLAATRAAPKVKGIYDQKLASKSNGSEAPSYYARLLAALATGQYLSAEAYSTVLGLFDNSTERLSDAVEEVKARTESRVEAGAEAFRDEAERVAHEIISS